MKLKVSESLSGLETVDYRILEPLQGSLKVLSTANKNKAINSLKKHGFFVPFFVWENKGKLFLLDGHQRAKILTEINAEPYELPCVRIDAANRKDAKTKLLAISSQYGKVTQSGLEDFLSDDGLELEDFLDSTTFDDILNEEPINFDELGRANSFSSNSDDYLDYTRENQGAQSQGMASSYSNNSSDTGGQSFAPDYSILDNDEQLNSQVEAMQNGVRKAILIEFEAQDYQDAFEEIKFWRSQKMYIGEFLIKCLKQERVNTKC